MKEKQKILRIFLVVAVAFIGLSAAFTFYYASNADAAEPIIKNFAGTVKRLTNSDGSLSVVGIFMNNLYVCGISLVIGAMPFLFLPALLLISNTIVIGSILGYYYSVTKGSLLKLVIYGMLPHGIFELPAIFLSLTLGIYLCKRITDKLLSRDKERKLMPAVNTCAKTFVLVIIPLLIIAALVEAYVTPQIMEGVGFGIGH